MKNYIYFGINNQSVTTLAQNMTDDVTIDTSAVADAGNGDLGGVALRTALVPGDIKVEVIPATTTTNYFGTDYAAGSKLGTRNAVAGVKYLLSEAETLTWANNSEDPLLLFLDGTENGAAHGILGKAGDKIIITVKGGAATDGTGVDTYGHPIKPTAVGGAGTFSFGTDGDGDGSTGTGATRGKGLSGICTVYPEDCFLGGQIKSATSTALYFKSPDGTYDRDTVTFTHTTGKGKQLLEEATALITNPKPYAGMTRIYDGVQPQFTLLSPGLGIIGVTIV